MYGTLGFGGVLFTYKLYRVGAGWNIATPSLYFLEHGYFAFNNNSEFPLERKVLMSLIMLAKKFNLGNLYNKPVCQVVSMVFVVYKNTTSLDILLLKCMVMWSASLIH
jgi:hypothetical protein